MNKGHKILKAVLLFTAGIPIFVFFFILFYLVFRVAGPTQKAESITFSSGSPGYADPIQEEDPAIATERQLRKNLKQAFQQLLLDIKYARQTLNLDREDHKKYLNEEQFRKKQQLLQLKRELDI